MMLFKSGKSHQSAGLGPCQEALGSLPSRPGCEISLPRLGSIKLGSVGCSTLTNALNGDSYGQPAHAGWRWI